AVWLTIKQKKKAIGKELKDLELAKEAQQLGNRIKAEKNRGAIFVEKDDLQILDELTNTNPFFSKHDLV
ncbi:hypothetical protein, partial [Burkholderia cenocepacia]|uniref:hypothetical protein n=1 Tax=Burkholderia cenocepacia TaxID=95486 RepID=UPI0015C54083